VACVRAATALADGDGARRAGALPISQGFEDWTRRDFQAFVKACERYGRCVGGHDGVFRAWLKAYQAGLAPSVFAIACNSDDKESISREVEGKTPEEVKEYLKVFLARYKELAGTERPPRGG